MKPRRAVLFDLGNVLIHYHPEYFWKVLGIDDPGEQNRLRNHLPAMFTPLEKGEWGFETCLDHLQRLFNGRYDRSKLVQAMESVLTVPIEGMEEIVRRVSERNVTALVSNTNEFHYAYCQRVVPALKYLQQHFVSFKIGATKPDRTFYERVVRELQLQPAEMLFIDDLEENVEAAEKTGMRGLVFHNPDRLLKTLQEWKII